MRPTAGTSTTTARTSPPGRRLGRRALALAAVMALPVMSACGTGAPGAQPQSVVKDSATEVAAASVSVQAASVARVQAQWVSAVSSAASSADPAAAGGVAIGREFADERFISQPDARRVLRIDGFGEKCTVAAAMPPSRDEPAWCSHDAVATPGLMPAALATDGGGDLFIADPQARQVFMVSHETGETTVVAGTGEKGAPTEGALATASPLQSVSGIAATADGDRLYIADSEARLVLVVDTSAVTTPRVMPLAATVVAGDTGEDAPERALPGTAGRIFVVAGPGCVPAADGSTRPSSRTAVEGTAASLATPTALALPMPDGGEKGDLFVGDPGNHQVYRVVPGDFGQQSALIAVSTDAPGLSAPVSLAVASENGLEDQLVAVDGTTGTLHRADASAAQLKWETVTTSAARPVAVAGQHRSLYAADAATGEAVGVTLDALGGEGQAWSVPQPVPGKPVCAAAPAPQPSSSSSTPSSGPTTDRDLTPQSTPSSSRPKVPGNAVVPDPGTHRFSGNDRVATSVDTSRKLFPKAGSVPVVVISSASSYADSAGGARYAAEKGGSLLLTPGQRLDPAVEAEVRRSLASGGSIVVTGREDAISPAVFSALEAIAPGRTERIGGIDRYETATKLAQRLADQMTTTATGSIYLVTGADYPDALVVVSLSRRTGGLIVLSKEEQLPPVTRALLQAMDPTGARTVPVGGAAAAAAASLGGEAGRTASAAAVVGSDRYETARKVAERFVALDAAAGARTDVVGLATGTTWPDALVGSTAMGTLVGPLLLSHGDQLDPNVVRALAAIPSSRPSTAVVFGGEAAVPASVMTAFGVAARG